MDNEKDKLFASVTDRLEQRSVSGQLRVRAKTDASTRPNHTLTTDPQCNPPSSTVSPTKNQSDQLSSAVMKKAEWRSQAKESIVSLVGSSPSGALSLSDLNTRFTALFGEPFNCRNIFGTSALNFFTKEMKDYLDTEEKGSGVLEFKIKTNNNRDNSFSSLCVEEWELPCSPILSPSDAKHKSPPSLSSTSKDSGLENSPSTVKSGEEEIRVERLVAHIKREGRVALVDAEIILDKSIESTLEYLFDKHKHIFQFEYQSPESFVRLKEPVQLTVDGNGRPIHDLHTQIPVQSLPETLEFFDKEEDRERLEERFVRVVVAQFYSPDHFYVRLQQFDQDLDSLMRGMHVFYTLTVGDEYKIPFNLIKPGVVCVALYQHFGFHRVKVTHVRPQNKVIVFYLDYGTYDQVSINELKYLSQQFSLLPAQAIEAELEGMKPTGNGWGESVQSKFLQLTKSDCPIFAYLYGIGDRLSVDLTRVEELYDIHISEVLVSERLAERIEPGKNRANATSDADLIQNSVRVSRELGLHRLHDNKGTRSAYNHVLAGEFVRCINFIFRSSQPYSTARLHVH